MFSDQEIRTAMDGLVKQKGEDHTSFGRYADDRGHGACFLGALCEFMGRAIPQEGTRPQDVLGVGTTSALMQDAFALAQYLNDQHFEWKYVLMGVDEVLSGNFDKQPLGCPCGCEIRAGYNSVIEKVRAKRALDRSKQGPPFSGKVSGGYITSGGMTIKNLNLSPISGSLGSLVFNIDVAASSMSALSQALQPVAAKKDHALTA